MLRHLTRLLIACVLLTPAIAGTAAASPEFQDLRPPDLRYAAQTAPAQDLRSPDAADASRAGAIALAQERYYENTTTEPVATPAPAAPANDTPWGSIAISAAAALLVMGGSAALVRRHRRAARVTA
jgi:hypothetical protein